MHCIQSAYDCIFIDWFGAFFLLYAAVDKLPSREPHWLWLKIWIRKSPKSLGNVHQQIMTILQWWIIQKSWIQLK